MSADRAHPATKPVTVTSEPGEIAQGLSPGFGGDVLRIAGTDEHAHIAQQPRLNGAIYLPKRGFIACQHQLHRYGEVIARLDLGTLSLRAGRWPTQRRCPGSPRLRISAISHSGPSGEAQAGPSALNSGHRSRPAGNSANPSTPPTPRLFSACARKSVTPPARTTGRGRRRKRGTSCARSAGREPAGSPSSRDPLWQPATAPRSRTPAPSTRRCRPATDGAIVCEVRPSARAELDRLDDEQDCADHQVGAQGEHPQLEAG